MIKATLLVLVKIAAGLLVAGAVMGILMPLMPGLIESWMVGVVVLLCIGGIMLATWQKNAPPLV